MCGSSVTEVGYTVARKSKSISGKNMARTNIVTRCNGIDWEGYTVTNGVVREAVLHKIRLSGKILALLNTEHLWHTRKLKRVKFLL